MRIGQLAKNAEVSVETIRYYQRRGLLAVPDRSYGANREYDFEHLERLQFIKRAKALGFSLSEVGALLSLSESDCGQVHDIAQHKLALVQEKISDLRRVESVLGKVVSECEARKPFDGCPIIQTLAESKT
ncbi:MAG: MerR family transcriptional regulator [Oceanococcus sp.]